MFFALGMQSVRSEVSDGTAEALIMTPLSRFRLVISKLAGSIELVVVSALLLPLYCFTLAPASHGDRVMAFMHGALLRLALTPNGWQPVGDQGLAYEALIGLGAFASDLAWYALFCACGVWAATSARTTVRSWLKGLAVSGLMLGMLTSTEWLMGDPGNLYWMLSALRRARWYELAYGLDFGWRERSMTWIAIWLGCAVAIRLLFALLFTYRAARNFDRIAMD
jgi:hypothetical protein